MKPLTQYGRTAEKHWREFRPKMVAELEAQNQLHAMLLTSEEQTEMELDQIRRKLIQQGATPQQAHDQFLIGISHMVSFPRPACAGRK